MATQFTLPELGENVAAGDVVRVLVKVGDTIARDQPVLELETDKATIEVPSSVAGKITEVRVKEGQKVKVGETVLVVDEAGAAAAPPPKQEVSGPPPGTPEAEEIEPSATVEEQEEAAEETVSEEDVQASLDTALGGLQQQVPGRIRRAETDKPGMSEQALEEAVEEPRAARRGEVVDIRGPRGAQAAEPEGPPRPAAPASPTVRRLAREIGVDIHQVPGSGPAGRITTEDVKAYAKQLLTSGAGRAPAGPGLPAVSLPDFTRWGEIERKPMRGVRRKTAEHLSGAWVTIPHVTQFDRADITELEVLRERYGKRAEAAGGKLTVTAIALKVVAAALKVFPQFNASIDMAAEEVVYKKYIHIGVAVDTDRGLLVPVIRDVDRKNIVELAGELARVSAKARAGKLTLEEMQGGTFSISNLGGIGGTHFTPIVNHPEVAILGISRSNVEPVYRDGAFVPRTFLPLSLSYDHRLIDGADGIRFLRWVCEALEQPFLLSLEGH